MVYAKVPACNGKKCKCNGRMRDRRTRDNHMRRELVLDDIEENDRKIIDTVNQDQIH